MKANDLIQVIFYIFALLSLAWPLGHYMARALEGFPKKGQLGQMPELYIYEVCRINPKWEMNWKEYVIALLKFNFTGFIVLFFMLIGQGLISSFPGFTWHQAFNIAVSFITNTNWQSYSGENALSPLIQMIGLTVQNFVSAATGLAVILAMARGFVKAGTSNLGNFWTDLTKTVLYILLPLSFLLSILLISQGVPQTFETEVYAQTFENEKQIIPLGPVASQISIKQLGSNGGGYYNANSAHPFENPTPISNFFEMLALLLIPAAVVIAFGRMIKNPSHARLLLFVMLAIWLTGLTLSVIGEYSDYPTDSLSFMEGKEQRFGVINSLIWSSATTAASNGSINAMHSSLSPLSVLVTLFNIMSGEVIFGGVGAGLYGILLFVLTTVFIVGLMVGRTPEYLGKKIEAKEMRMVILAILLPNASILIGSGLSAILPKALASLSHTGPHGLSEILYAFASASGNNGSALAGINSNTAYYNIFLGFCMLIGRFGVIIPCLAIAGSLAEKKISTKTSGTLSTDNFIFGLVLSSIIFIVGALTFFPALALGPIVEHFLLKTGQLF